MFCLFALGEPWRMMIRKFTGLFRSLDFLQIAVLDIFLGSSFLYVVAVIPLHLFHIVTLYAITAASFIVIFWFHHARFKNVFKRFSLHSEKISFPNKVSFGLILVVLMFLFSLFIQTSPFSHVLFGSVRDTSIHSLFVQVLIENKQVPLTLKPYLDEGIIYPQGFTPIAAYFGLIFNCLPPAAIFYLTTLFNALTVMGAYFLGKALSKESNLGLILAFVFTFVAFWPKYITWGSNAFVASFPLFFVCLSFIPYLAKEKGNIGAIFVIGVLFGYLSVLHLQTFEMLIAALFVWWLGVALKKQKDRWIGIRNFILVSCISLIILSPFIYRVLAFYSYPFHNVGVPGDVEISSPRPDLSIIVSGIVWLFENVATNIALKIASLTLVFVSVVAIMRFRTKNSLNQASELIKIGIATFLGELLTFLFSAFSTELPFYPQPLLLYFPLYFFIAALTFGLYHFFSSRLSRKISRIDRLGLVGKKILVIVIPSALLLGTYFPFLYQGFVLDAAELRGSYAAFGVTTEQDLQLILWIRDNLTRDAIILVNTFQSGTFIPSIANRKVVFPSFGSSYSVSYQKLVALLEARALNTTTLSLMKQFNITNIYVGSGISPWDGWMHWWNPKLFLGNPSFDLVKNFGNAYLFQFNFTDSLKDIVFLDDFEYALWNQNGWQRYFYGNGLGNTNITAKFGYNSPRSLKMTSQLVSTALEWKYANVILREFFVQNNSDVTFSFYFNATEGFNGEDTFAAVISNAYRNESVVLTTPNGVYKDYIHAELLDTPEGVFSFPLTTLWQQSFNSSIPNPFILEFVNWDFDGIENVAYIDNVTLISTPIP